MDESKFLTNLEVFLLVVKAVPMKVTWTIQIVRTRIRWPKMILAKNLHVFPLIIEVKTNAR